MLTDEVVFTSATVTVGKFRCTADDPRFRDTGPIHHFVVVFPRTGVWIQHAGSDPFVADPTVVTIYNRGQEYRRAPLCRDGDRGDWFAVSHETALAMVMDADPAAADTPERPFRREFAPSSPHLYARQRKLLRAIESGRAEGLAIEEAVITLVAEIVCPVDSHRVGPKQGRAAEAHRDLAMRARAELVREVAVPLTVTALAARLGVSPWHLCRVFKAETGMTLQAYRRELRLRLALERLASHRTGCSVVAHELGFSSHSHFTSVFRRQLGETPSQIRASLAPA